MHQQELVHCDSRALQQALRHGCFGSTKKYQCQQDGDNAEVSEGGETRDGTMGDMQGLNLSDTYRKMGSTLVE